ncbi:winged helix-turn-helix domain-containing protein [Nocardioides bruguierae]|uniref:Winged helix-turn-helix domain-containing protein n=1 Tax=Nocardioides bruguierae TaxID=2945102 RepID=A0A9X2D693_9ACTN|nr:winged helix-turn-helix domain-containing protein [Nocardioides bruguierae]MCL8025067.1 winged helix-turn-helix domain-containing protein [Nocardioides bruguierae]MCM0620128.1 winged helix-turn-helix domain-containing protein [Nocardioides bruguierae]
MTRKRVSSTSGSTSSTTRRTSSTRVPGAPAKPPVVHRRTPTVEFKPFILLLLQEAGGEREADLLYDELPERMSEQMRPGDHETGPTGELRWRTAARKARKELADEGFVQAPQPGVLELTDRGRALPPVFDV